MHPLTLRTVRQAQTRGAALDLLTHFDAVATLDRVARETDGTSEMADADVVDRPIIVGHIDNRRFFSGVPAILYTPSYAALDWMERAGEWFAGDRKLSLLAGAWALAYARDPETLLQTARADLAERTIKRWARSLNCSLSALASAYNEIMQPAAAAAQTDRSQGADASQPQGSGGRLLRVLLRLQSEIGQDQDYWLYGPIERLRAGVALLKEKDDADAKALAKAQGKALARDPDSPDVQAFVRWRAAVDTFFKVIGLVNE